MKPIDAEEKKTPKFIIHTETKIPEVKLPQKPTVHKGEPESDSDEKKSKPIPKKYKHFQPRYNNGYQQKGGRHWEAKHDGKTLHQLADANLALANKEAEIKALRNQVEDYKRRELENKSLDRDLDLPVIRPIMLTKFHITKFLLVILIFWTIALSVLDLLSFIAVIINCILIYITHKHYIHRMFLIYVILVPLVEFINGNFLPLIITQLQFMIYRIIAVPVRFEWWTFDDDYIIHEDFDQRSVRYANQTCRWARLRECNMTRHTYYESVSYAVSPEIVHEMSNMLNRVSANSIEFEDRIKAIMERLGNMNIPVERIVELREGCRAYSIDYINSLPSSFFEMVQHQGWYYMGIALAILGIYPERLM